MGGEMSAEQKQSFASELFQVVQSSQKLPDIGIDYSMLKYSGLDSASALENYSVQLLKDLAKTAAFVKDLCSNFSDIPSAVGLGAFIISYCLDNTVSQFKEPESGDVLGMMRRVFAEEKASGVRDSMDEYMNRFELFKKSSEDLLKETKRIEEKISEKLTQLRNSMLTDNQMSTRSMKHWVNGAAFHLQMFIHIARMERAKGTKSEAELNSHVSKVRVLADRYENELKNLLERYEKYKHSTISIELMSMESRPNVIAPGRTSMYTECGVHDTELNLKAGVKIDPFHLMTNSHCSSVKDPYVAYMFNNWNQIKELRNYFPRIKQNLRKVILQNPTFDIKKFL